MNTQIAAHEVRARASRPTDLSDHLETIFEEALEARPRLIVELGVRGGESTFVLERVARLTGAVLVSCDVDDCSRVSSWEDWLFVRSDDVAFAAEFPEWCRERGISPEIDVLFVDTEHSLEHTRKELAAWVPHLAHGAKAIFHDSNMRPDGRRRDGAPCPADLQRGVALALQELLGVELDFSRDFALELPGWRVRHAAYCHGLTVLQRT